MRSSKQALHHRTLHRAVPTLARQARLLLRLPRSPPLSALVALRLPRAKQELLLLDAGLVAGAAALARGFLVAASGRALPGCARP